MSCTDTSCHDCDGCEAADCCYGEPCPCVASVPEKWRAILSPVAWRLYEAIQREGEIGMAELQHELRASKTAIRNAIAELERHGFIDAAVEES